jgi:hypothetical protein
MSGANWMPTYWDGQDRDIVGGARQKADRDEVGRVRRIAGYMP